MFFRDRCGIEFLSMILIDLYSQREAFNEHTKSMTEEEKLNWLRQQGELTAIPHLQPAPRTYRFRSKSGIEATFFFQQDRPVFIGDHFVIAD